MPPAPPTAATDAAGGGRVFETPPAPPVFRARRRFFAGHTGLRRLADALQPGTEGASPLVFLSGGAGSGKTWLALEAARRLHRRFAMVLYLHDRMLLPHPFDTAPVTGLARPADPPGKPLFAALACHLHAPPASNGALSEWKEAIVRHCSDGVPRLLILDGLEHRPGHAGLCEALAALPPACRALVVTRDKPPLVPGVHLEQTPVSPAELGRMFDEGLPERLRALDPQGRLLEHCCGDLFAARLLRRHPAPPSPERLREALAPAEQGPSPAVRLLELLVEDALPSLGEEVREVLAVLALLPALVHREALAGSCALDDRRLQVVLDELQWLGWVDLHESDRYVELAHRLHRPVAERLLTLGALARVQARLIRVYQAFLAGLATDLEHQGSRWRTLPPPLLAWAEERCEGQPPGRMLLLHRLGVERVNLAELALLLCEEGDWRPLARLVAGAFPLAGWRELEELWGLLHHCLLAAGEARADPVMQAQALNRLAEPALRVRNAERARPMLERALELLGRTPGWEVLGETYRMLARCYELLGKLDPALNLLYAAVELAQQLDNPEDLVRACERLVPLWVRRGADGAAAERFLARQALDLRQNGRHPHAALVARLQGELLLRLGRPEEAIVLLHDVLESFHALDDGRGRADTLVHLAECHVRLGEGERALELMTTAGDPGAASAGAAEERGRVWSELCRLFEQRNQPQQALEGYLSIRRLLEEMGDREALIGVLDRIGGLYYQLGEQAKSTQCYEERLHLQAALTPS
jgi:tetratricopeptide (TPR) repeat protein